MQQIRMAVFGAGLALGCAVTTPTPPPPRDVLVVLNAGDSSLSLVPVPGGGPPETIPLGSIGGTPQALAARGSQLLVTTRGGTVARLDLATGLSAVVYRLPPEAGAGGAVWVDDTLAYVTNPGNGRVTRFNFRTGDTVSAPAGQVPMTAALARGRLFVANANTDPGCPFADPCLLGPSWLTVLDPIGNTGLDSVPLVGPGNAVAIEVGGDGLLYVLNAGARDGASTSGRVSIVDPITRTELGSFAGFGELPNGLASDRRERLFVTSEEEGLMEFNTRTRRLVRGAGEGIPLQGAVAAAVDGTGLIYTVESGSCSTVSPGRVRIFRPDLTELRVVLTRSCSIAAALVKLPPE